MMKNQINIAEILKDCPKGTKLYSPLCGECYFDSLNMGTIICKKQNTQEITFTSGGYYMLPVFADCECQLFPSKDQRDWSKFQRPFEDGDIVATNSGCFIGIIEIKNNIQVGTYCAIDYKDDFKVNPDYVFGRIATEEEKQKLFDAIKANGYKWNEETKTLEKLVEPKFKVGDRIRSIISNSGYIYNVIEIKESLYVVSKNDEDDNKLIDFKIQDYWELVPNKFDVTTLKPFDKVLVRGGVGQKWTHDFFGFMDKDKGFPFVCVGYYVSQCIPYEGNEHLLGKTDDCAEYYKTWEK